MQNRENKSSLSNVKQVLIKMTLVWVTLSFEFIQSFRTYVESVIDQKKKRKIAGIFSVGSRKFEGFMIETKR